MWLILYSIVALAFMVLCGYVEHQEKGSQMKEDEIGWAIAAGAFWPLCVLLMLPGLGITLSKWKNKREQAAKEAKQG